MNKDLSGMTNPELLSATTQLRSEEKKVLHQLLLHIAEVDERKLYREAGYSSLFHYMTEALQYSEASSYRRIQVARCVKKFPMVYDKLQDGSLSFSAAVEISKVAKTENIEELLRVCVGKSRVETERIVVAYGKEVPRKKESIRVVKTISSTSKKLPLVNDLGLGDQNKSLQTTSAAEVKAEERYAVSLQVDKEFMKLYMEVKALSGGNDMEGALKRVMKEFVKKTSPKERVKRRQERVSKKRAAQKKEKLGTSRYIPIATRDQVFLRDNGKCTFVSEEAVVCNCIEHLEFDHITPFALGGEHVVGNLRLRCTAHNQLEAERAFGKEYMSQHR